MISARNVSQALTILRSRVTPSLPVSRPRTVVSLQPFSTSMPADGDAHRISSSFLSFRPDPVVKTYLVVLNFSLPQATVKLWHQASYRVCADGGSNRLYDGLPSMLGVSGPEAELARSTFLPDIILGDLDSIRQDVRDFYTSRRVPVVDLSEDQDTTDLGKCLTHIEKRLFLDAGQQREGAHADGGIPSPSATAGGLGVAADSLAQGEPVGLWEPIDANGNHKAAMSRSRAGHQVLVLGAMGGRLDHTMSNLNSLYQFPGLNIILWGEGNLVRLLPVGRSVIRPFKGLEGPSCGLVPLGGPATATSSGLRWNLENTKMEISGLISTCNQFESEEIRVATDRELLWITAVSEEL